MRSTSEISVVRHVFLKVWSDEETQSEVKEDSVSPTITKEAREIFIQIFSKVSYWLRLPAFGRSNDKICVVLIVRSLKTMHSCRAWLLPISRHSPCRSVVSRTACQFNIIFQSFASTGGARIVSVGMFGRMSEQGTANFHVVQDIECPCQS